MFVTVTLTSKCFTMKAHLLYFPVMAPFMLKPLLKLGFTFIPKESSAFLRDVVNQAVNAREKDGHVSASKMDIIVTNF